MSRGCLAIFVKFPLNSCETPAQDRILSLGIAYLQILTS
jgi:hypothetical protein